MRSGCHQRRAPVAGQAVRTSIRSGASPRTWSQGGAVPMARRKASGTASPGRWLKPPGGSVEVPSGAPATVIPAWPDEAPQREHAIAQLASIVTAGSCHESLAPTPEQATTTAKRVARAGGLGPTPDVAKRRPGRPSSERARAQTADPGSEPDRDRATVRVRTGSQPRPEEWHSPPTFRGPEPSGGD